MERGRENAILVAHDGRICDPQFAKRVTPGPSHVFGALEIRDSQTLARLRSALIAAGRDRRTTSLRWREGSDGLGNLITVRPAHDPGLAVVSVINLDAPLAILEPEALADIFEFTKAEAEIAIGMFLGSDLSEIARDRGVKLTTVRGQVKGILAKVGVASQKQLMLLLSRIAMLSNFEADDETDDAAAHALRVRG